MKKSSFVAVIYCLFIVSIASAQSLNVASYNIRLKTDNDVGNLWNDRKEALCNLIKFHQFDIFGTQEGFIDQLEDMRSLLPNFDFVGVGRDDGQRKGEHSAIFFNTEKFEIIDNGTFWLSATDTQSPNKGWDAALPRVCTWGIFKDKEADRQFIFMNTHFDHVGVEARKESAKLMLKKAGEFAADLPLIITGDFNIDQNNESYLLLVTSGIVKDVYELSPIRYTPSSTFNGWGKSLRENQRIDHIFITNELIVKKYGILTDTYMGKYPSDHFPVFTVLEWK